MKKTTKKIFLGLGLSLLGTVTFAQNGLEKIIVEKYYISTKEDSVASADAFAGTLPVGSVTYRVYADMLPGYRFQALYGNSDHPLKIATTTSFFNNEDRGATTANGIASAQLKNNTVALDSWFSVGASAVGQFGVLKTEDDGAANLLNTSAILNNLDPALGIGLKTQDGNMAGKPEAVTLVGFTNELDVFDAISQSGNSLITNDAAISALSGATGPTAENRILLGQFTTDGVFTFELNIQIGTPTAGVSEKYVASNPIHGEFSIPTLIRTGNNPPVVAITSPSNNAKVKAGESTTITANASDSDGTITQVEFYVDGKSVGIDSTAPYEHVYTAISGSYLLTSIAKDNKGDSTVSAPITIYVTDNQAPTVNIEVAPTAMTGDIVAIKANANDSDGSVASVEFFVDNVSVGKDSTLPFSTTWIAQVGTFKIKAIATDNKGLTANSSEETIQVTDNQAPTVSINVVPTAMSGDKITLIADAKDVDGTIASVEFFVDDVSVGTISTAPFTLKWNATVGTHKVKVVATDNKGLTGTSSDSTIIVKEKENSAPVVSVNIPSTANTGDVVTLTATANDNDGTVASVEFFVDNVSVGKDSTLPFSTTWIAQVGTFKIKAIATDNKGLTANSSEETIQVTDNQAPTVSINVVPTAMSGDKITLIADAKDVDGTIASVEFFVDDVSVGTISTAPFTLKWNATVGTHKVKVVATDNKGLTGTSSDSTIIVKEKENSAPVVSVNIPSTANTGDVVTLTATANDNDGTVASVEFFVDNVSVGKDSTLPFSTTWIAQVGTFKIKAIATDNKGLTANSSEETIQVTDNQAPTVSINVVPTAMSGDMIAINANAKDADGTIDSVQFFVDETYLGTDTSAPHSINWNAISGTHKIKAIAIDNKGLKGISKDSTIIVKDNVAPIVTVSTPANAITGDSIVITATASDSDGSIASVEFFVDDVSIGTDPTSPYAISYKTTVGKHFIKAIATDNFGLKGTSKIDSITVVNNQAPVVTIQTPKNAITGDEVTFTSTAIDKDGTITQVEFFVDNISVGIDTIAPYANKWIAKVGVHKIKAIATDNRGFTGTSADSLLEVIDNKAPLIELIVDSTAIVGANVLITANATDTDGSIKKVEFFIDNVVLASDSIAPYTSTWKAVAGKHTIKILATDNRGLTSTKTKDIMVTDNNVSIETIAANLQTLVYPNPANQELSIIASENASVEITDISGKVIAYKNELIANTTHHVAVSEFSAGVYLIRIFNANYTKTERVVINN